MENKMKRIVILIGAIVSMFLLTACASYTTTTNFNKDGSGNVIVTVYADYSDESRLEGGYPALDAVLQEAKPEDLEITKDDVPENSQYVYSFQLEFSSIEDYKAKLEVLSGETPEITWDFTETAFRSALSYSNNLAQDAIIKWARDAIDASGISSYSASEMYDVKTCYINYNGEEVWSGYYNPSFDINTGVGLLRTDIYTTYDQEGNGNKRIELYLEESNFATMDQTLALEELKKYSNAFAIDQANYCITLDLKNVSEMKQFFDNVLKVSEGNTEEASFTCEVQNSSLFAMRYYVSEEYSLYNLLNEFEIINNDVNNYVSIPEMEYDQQYSSGWGTPDVPADSKYNYQDCFSYNDWYYMEYEANQEIRVNKINVDYELHDDMSGQITTSIDFNKNGCEIDEASFEEFYKDLEEDKTYKEAADQVTVNFTKKFGIGSAAGNKNSVVQLVKSDLSSLVENIYSFDCIYDVKTYLPMSGLEVSHRIKVPDELNIKLATIDDHHYYGDRLKQLHQNGNYIYDFATYDDIAVMSLTIVKTNIWFYIIIVASVLLVAGAGVALFFRIKKKKSTKPSVDQGTQTNTQSE